MVQILPQKTNVGSQIGQALGGGLQKGMEQGFQRGMLQQALGKVRTASKEPNANPIDLMLNLMEAGAGIPGSERYLQALLPALLGKARTENLYGAGQGAGVPATPQEASKQATKSVYGPEPAGFLAPPMNPEQIQDYATQYANVLGTPEAFDQGLNQAQALNESRESSRANFEKAALGMGVTPEELPRYMQIATNFQHLKDPQAINQEAFKEFQKIKNNKEALRNLSVPGIGRTAIKAGGGLLGHLASGKEGRQDYLKRYDQLVKKLVNDGEEPYVRSELAKLGLSPTEVEERIHPLAENTKKAIESLPDGNKMNPQARRTSLVNFFKKNVTNDTSLSVLRRYLVKDKGYSWQEVSDAVNGAFPDGQSLTGYQSAEMAELSKAPRDSLIDIFRGTGNVFDFLRGKV